MGPWEGSRSQLHRPRAPSEAESKVKASVKDFEWTLFEGEGARMSASPPCTPTSCAWSLSLCCLSLPARAMTDIHAMNAFLSFELRISEKGPRTCKRPQLLLPDYRCTTKLNATHKPIARHEDLLYEKIGPEQTPLSNDVRSTAIFKMRSDACAP